MRDAKTVDYAVANRSNSLMFEIAEFGSSRQSGHDDFVETAIAVGH